MARGKLIATAIIVILINVLFISSMPDDLWAQGGATGAIAGTVIDRSGGLVPNAAVRIVDEATGQDVRKMTAGSNGNFTVTLLPPGNYTILATAPGFGESRATGI